VSSVAQRRPFARWLMLVLLCCAVSTAFAVESKKSAEALIKSSESAIRVDPELSKRNAEAALELLKVQPDADLEVQAYLLLCDYYSERDRALAEAQIAKAKLRLPQVKRQGLKANVANYEGEIYEAAGDNASAGEFYQQAVQLAEAANDDEMLGKALYSRGYILGLQGDYTAGLTDLRRSQVLFDKLSLTAYSLNALNSIALLYNRLGDYTQAAHIYEQALKAQREKNMRREEAVTLHNLARAHENLEQWDIANQEFAAALALCQELHYSRVAAYALRGLAAVATAKHDPNTALDYLQRATELQKETPDALLKARIALARGIALHQVRRLDEAATALEEAKQTLQQAASFNDLGSAVTELASVYADLGNWHKAYEARSEAQNISNAVLRNQLDQRFAALKVEFDTATKEKENELLTRENRANQKALAQGERARNLQAAVIALSAILAVLLGIMAWHQRRGKQRMRTLAMTDELTAVPNRRAVLTRLEAILQRRDAPSCATLIIDIDHFKSINDQFGHPAGDEILKLVSQQLRVAAVPPAFPGRLGGEEFVLVLPDTSVEAAMLAAEKFRESIAALDLTRWLTNRRVTVSIGVTVSVAGTDTPSTVLRRADAALYAAKNDGRNCVKCELPRAQSTLIYDVEEASLLMTGTKLS